MSNINIRIAIAGTPAQTHNYEKACRLLNQEPVTTLRLSDFEACDALILPGGGDITPGFYGQTIHGARNIDTKLDLLQIQALESFLHARKPILGICKGMQLINIYFGGTLIQDLRESERHQRPDGDVIHQAYVTKDCILSRLFGSSFPVNSNHHQAVDRLGNGLKIIQYAEDGVVEAIRNESLPILGVQWHPERFPEVQTSSAINRMKELLLLL